MLNGLTAHKVVLCRGGLHADLTFDEPVPIGALLDLLRDVAAPISTALGAIDAAKHEAAESAVRDGVRSMAEAIQRAAGRRREAAQPANTIGNADAPEAPQAGPELGIGRMIEFTHTVMPGRMPPSMPLGEWLVAAIVPNVNGSADITYRRAA